MGDAGVITLFSMGIVFATLLLISFVLDLFKVIFTKKKEEKIEKIDAAPVAQTTQAVVEEEDELVAVITAALAAHIGKSTDQLIVRSIVQTGNQQPAWSQAGRMELMQGSTK
jgi:sodium pump decarboxylase gamma subunit